MSKERTFPSGWKTKIDTPCPLLAPCADCKQLLPVTDFYPAKNKRRTILGTSIVSVCASCSIERYKKLDPRIKLLYAAKQRANKFGLEFNLTVDDIEIPEFCPIRGVKITDGTGTGPRNSSLNSSSASLDRINNQRGYTPDNVRVISRRANLVKSNASPSELIQIMIYMIKNKHAMDKKDLELLENLRKLLDDFHEEQYPKGGDFNA